MKITVTKAAKYSKAEFTMTGGELRITMADDDLRKLRDIVWEAVGDVPGVPFDKEKWVRALVTERRYTNDHWQVWIDNMVVRSVSFYEVQQALAEVRAALLATIPPALTTIPALNADEAAELTKLRGRLRDCTQRVVNAVGADGPTNLEDALDKLLSRPRVTRTTVDRDRPETWPPVGEMFIKYIEHLSIACSWVDYISMPKDWADHHHGYQWIRVADVFGEGT